MDVQLFVFGTPNGESFWGNINSEQPYFSTYYNSSKDQLRFSIEARCIDDRVYYYYSYLVYANMADSGNRPGAFFGISLRFDQYYTDYISIYRILDWVFNYHIIGNILQKNGNNFKYSVPSFESVKSNLQTIERIVIDRLSQTLSRAYFTSLKSSQKSGQVQSLNIPEATDLQVTEALQRSSKVNLSPFYPKANDAEIARQYRQKIDQLNLTANNCLKENETLKDQNKKLNQDLNISKQKEKELKDRLDKQNSSQSLKNAVEIIKTPIQQLAEYFSRENLSSDNDSTEITPQKNNHKTSKTKQAISIRKLLNLLYKISTFILLFCIFCMLTFCKRDNNKAEQKQEPEKTAYEQFPSSMTATASADNFNNPELDKYNYGRIDIEPISNGKLKKNQSVTIKFLIGNTLVDNGEIYINDSSYYSPKVTLTTPPDKDSLKIEFRIAGKIIKTRNIPLI